MKRFLLKNGAAGVCLLALLLITIGCAGADAPLAEIDATTSAAIEEDISSVIAPPATTSAPTTAAPVTTPAPTTAAPVTTPAPTTAAPVTTPVPTTAKPATTPVPTTAKPVTTPAPTTAKPVTTPTPTTAKPAATRAPIVFDPPKLEEKLVAFSFDDGPHPELTRKFVDKLKEYGATATFFVVGNRVSGKSGEAIRYAYENGCEIGSHSYTHTNFFKNCGEAVYQEEIRKADAAIRAYIEDEVRLLRPPGGSITSARLAESEYSIILWNVDSEDWRYTKRSSAAVTEQNIQKIVDNVMRTVDPGDIVLMHEIYQNSYEAFCIIIDELYKQGYKVVSVSELLGDNLQPGVLYYSYNNAR